MTHTSEHSNLFQRLRAFYFLWRGKVRRHWGIVFNSSVEFARAVELYSRAVKLNPALSVAYLERGILFWRELNQATRAIADFDTALELRPGWPEAFFCRGVAYQTIGNYQAAVQDLDAYLRSGDEAWRESATRQVALIRSLLRDFNPEEATRHEG